MKTKKIQNCGSCLHLGHEKVFDKVCSTLGKIPTSKACGSYSPNVFMIAEGETNFNRVAKLAESMHGMSNSQLQALSAVVHAEINTRKQGYTFMQRVYVRYVGSSERNYLSNFMVGHVLYVTKDFIRIIGDSGRTFLSLIPEKNGSSYYTEERFAELREKMLSEGKKLDPKLSASKHSTTARLGAMPPMDEVVAEGKYSGSGTLEAGDDLVSIVSRMSRGMIGKAVLGKKPKAKKKAAPVVEQNVEIQMR